MLYLFQLGRQSEISVAELHCVFSFFSLDVKILEQKNANLFVEIKNAFDPKTLMNRLGGTMKIARYVGDIRPNDEMTSEEKLAEIIESLQLDGKIQFSLTGNNAKELALETKKVLKKNGRSVRYIEAGNTATILHNSLVQKSGDFTITHHGLFVTEAIQPIEEWGQRDFGRPGRDSKSGMLPPKLARIMINIAGGKKVTLENVASQVLLDPFCGSGTILMEAILSGYKSILGADVSDKAINDTKVNTDWVLEQIETEKLKTLKILQVDVRKSADKIGPESIDIIATEPFMGKPLRGNEQKEHLMKQAHELKTLYINAFQAFARIMKKDASIVFLIPRFKHKQEWIRINCSEDIQKLGFTVEPLSNEFPFLVYSRPDQFVAREIWKFTKK